MGWQHPIHLRTRWVPRAGWEQPATSPPCPNPARIWERPAARRPGPRPRPSSLWDSPVREDISGLPRCLAAGWHHVPGTPGGILRATPRPLASAVTSVPVAASGPCSTPAAPTGRRGTGTGTEVTSPRAAPPLGLGEQSQGHGAATKSQPKPPHQQTASGRPGCLRRSRTSRAREGIPAPGGTHPAAAPAQGSPGQDERGRESSPGPRRR